MVWSVSVSFTPPDNGGAEITGYTVTSIPDGITASGPTSPIIVEGLQDGTAYAFTVHATNVNGNGPESLKSNTLSLDADSMSISPLSVTASQLVPNDYYTTVLYPIMVEDTLTINSLVTQNGYIYNAITDPLTISSLLIQTGSLNTTIAYKTYNDWPTDPLTISSLLIQSGSLDTTIAYKTYNDWPTDPLTISSLSVQSGSLITTIAYQTYNNWPADTLTINSLSVQSGSLT